MKLTLTNIKSIKQNTSNKLMQNVCGYIIDNWHDYDNKKAIFTDVLNYGCQSGIVGSLIFYSDTMRFYQKYKNEISTLLYDLMAETGLYSLDQLFGDKFDKEDPLLQECTNQNLLAWFGFEQTLRNIAMEFEELRNYV